VKIRERISFPNGRRSNCLFEGFFRGEKMRWILIAISVVTMLAFANEPRAAGALTAKAGPTEVKRACKKYLAMSPAKQLAIAKRSKKYSRKQMLWACGIILSRGAGTTPRPGSGGPVTQPEPSWQCRAEGEVGRQPVSGTGIGDSQSTAQAYAMSNCAGDCHPTTCIETQQGSSSQWYCWAEGYSQSRKETFDGYTENDRSRAEGSALSACSWRAKDCSISSCSSR